MKTLRNLQHRNTIKAILVTMVTGMALPVFSSEEVDYLRTDSQAAALHHVSIYDANGKAIFPSDGDTAAVSLDQTCGKCHDTGAIATGWHFNAMDPEVKKGRPGEPWILTDPQTGTQLPLSYREWDGTWTPQSVGMSQWDFVKTFGLYLPGGGPGIAPDEENAAAHANWEEAGSYEIDCLSCHTLDTHYDFTARKRALEKDQFQYISIFTNHLGEVDETSAASDTGSGMSDDPFAEFAPDMEDMEETASLLDVIYNDRMIDKDDRVWFDLSAKGLDKNCYTCHSRLVTEPAKEANRFEQERDIHLASGLNCTDCHRNGINHQIVRGYEWEGHEQQNTTVTSLSCQGCHEGSQGGEKGHYGAPDPIHKGLPPIHFEELSCTACHSGPLPQNNLQIVQTSFSHQLGLPEFERREKHLPYIQQPVYLRQADGKLAPHRILWPSFWATMGDEGTITPLLPEKALEILGTALESLNREKHDFHLNEESLTTVLSASLTAGQPLAYIANGMLFQVDDSGNLTSQQHGAAKPYAWPIGHDVRPASQSMGVKGCTECHSTDSSFLFSEVLPLSPLEDFQVPTTMIDFAQVDKGSFNLLSLSFITRPLFKLFLGTVIAAISLLLLAYACRAVFWVTRQVKAKGGAQ